MTQENVIQQDIYAMDIIIAHMEMMKKIVVKNNKLTYKCNTSYMARGIFMLYIHPMYKVAILTAKGVHIR